MCIPTSPWQIALNALCTTGEEVEESDGEAEEGIVAAPVGKGQKDAGAVYKSYNAFFIWAQLNTWYKQTLSDPVHTLRSDRRGTICIPDIESAFTGRSRYTTKVSSGKS